MRKARNTKEDNIQLDQTIKLIAQRTGVHIGDVEVVFDELRLLVIEKAPTKRIDIGIGFVEAREYGWKNYNTGMMLSPAKSVLKAMREGMDKQKND